MKKNMGKTNRKRSKDKKKPDLHNQIIQRKNEEIESLKDRISKLEIDIDTKDNLLDSVDYLREDLKNTVDDLKDKRDKYDELIDELMMMRKVMSQEFFKGEWRWRIVKFLIR